MNKFIFGILLFDVIFYSSCHDNDLNVKIVDTMNGQKVEKCMCPTGSDSSSSTSTWNDISNGHSIGINTATSYSTNKRNPHLNRKVFYSGNPLNYTYKFPTETLVLDNNHIQNYADYTNYNSAKSPWKLPQYNLPNANNYNTKHYYNIPPVTNKFNPGDGFYNNYEIPLAPLDNNREKIINHNNKPELSSAIYKYHRTPDKNNYQQNYNDNYNNIKQYNNYPWIPNNINNNDDNKYNGAFINPNINRTPICFYVYDDNSNIYPINNSPYSNHNNPWNNNNKYVVNKWSNQGNVGNFREPFNNIPSFPNNKYKYYSQGPPMYHPEQAYSPPRPRLYSTCMYYNNQNQLHNNQPLPNDHYYHNSQRVQFNSNSPNEKNMHNKNKNDFQTPNINNHNTEPDISDNERYGITINQPNSKKKHYKIYKIPYNNDSKPNKIPNENKYQASPANNLPNTKDHNYDSQIIPVKIGPPIIDDQSVYNGQNIPINNNLPNTQDNSDYGSQIIPVNIGLPNAGDKSNFNSQNIPINNNLPNTQDNNDYGSHIIPVNIGLPNTGDKSDFNSQNIPINNNLPNTQDNSDYGSQVIPVDTQPNTKDNYGSQIIPIDTQPNVHLPNIQNNNFDNQIIPTDGPYNANDRYYFYGQNNPNSDNLQNTNNQNNYGSHVVPIDSGAFTIKKQHISNSQELLVNKPPYSNNDYNFYSQPILYPFYIDLPYTNDKTKFYIQNRPFNGNLTHTNDDYFYNSQNNPLKHYSPYQIGAYYFNSQQQKFKNEYHNDDTVHGQIVKSQNILANVHTPYPVNYPLLNNNSPNPSKSPHRNEKDSLNQHYIYFDKNIIPNTNREKPNTDTNIGSYITSKFDDFEDYYNAYKLKKHFRKLKDKKVNNIDNNIGVTDDKYFKLF